MSEFFPGGVSTNNLSITQIGNVVGTPEKLEDTDGDDAFAATRKPLKAVFDFGGDQVTVINNHFSSKGGCSPLFGAQQPPVNGRVANRTAQAEFVNAHVDGNLAADPQAKVVVLGDLNEFQFETPLAALAGTLGGGVQVLFNLGAPLPTVEKYSFIFEGNSQELDHVLVSANLLALGPQFEVVHANTKIFGAPATTTLRLPACVWLTARHRR